MKEQNHLIGSSHRGGRLAYAWFATFGALLLEPTVAPAQDRPALDRNTGTGLEEIIVTARKTEESLQTTPVAVTALTARALEERNISDVTDLALSTPSLVLQTSGVNGSAKTPAIYLRGLGQFDTTLNADPAVGLYVDGIFVSRNTGSILDLVDLQRVEILRGPQGTLFGKNTIGGAINLVTVKPDSDFAYSAEASVGNYDRLTGKAMINVPISDKAMVRLSAFGNRQNGYVKLDNYPGRELGDERTWSVRGQLRILPASNLTLDLAADYSLSRSAGSPLILLGIFPGSLAGTFYNAQRSGNPASCTTATGQATNPACFGSVRLPGSIYHSNALYLDRNLNKIDPEGSFETTGVSLTAKWDLPFGSIQSISAYRGLRSRYFGDTTPVGDLVWQTNLGPQNADQYSQELQVSGQSFDNRMKWIVGAYYLHEQTFSHAEIISVASLAPFVRAIYPVLADNDQTIRTNNYALFGQATFDVTAWLHLTGGLRWTYEKKTSLLIVRPNTPNGLRGEREVRRATPLVSLGADFAENLFGYISYSKGFRSGGFPPRIVGAVASIPDYGPEEAESWEAGLKLTAIDNKLRVNIAIFNTNFRDFQGSGTRLDLIPPIPTTINAGDARIRGAELEIAAAPARNFQVDLSGSYLDTKLTRVDPTLNDGGIPVPVGNRLPYAPKWKVAAGAGWTVPFDNGASIALRADVSMSSLIYFSLLNERSVAQPSNVLLNGGVTFNFPGDRIQLVASAKNLTDRRYYTTKLADRSSAGSLLGALGEPRTGMLTVRVKY